MVINRALSGHEVGPSAERAGAPGLQDDEVEATGEVLASVVNRALSHDKHVALFANLAAQLHCGGPDILFNSSGVALKFERKGS